MFHRSLEAWLTKRIWCRRQDLEALLEEAHGEQLLTTKESTPTLPIVTVRTSLSNHLRKTQLPVDGWQWMPALAKYYGPQLILAMPPPMVLWPLLMVSSLVDQHIQQDQYMPWMPGLGKSYGHTTLEPLCMGASQWVMDASISGMDIRSILDPLLHPLPMEPHFLPSVSNETMHLQCQELPCYPWINHLIVHWSYWK